MFSDVYREFEQTELNVRGTLSQLPQNALPGSVREKVSVTLTSLSQYVSCTFLSSAGMSFGLFTTHYIVVL